MTENKSTREILAEKLRYYRQLRGLTIYEVGEMIGKSGKTVHSWERGHGQPDAEMLLKLCDIYEIDDLNVFFGKSAKNLSDEENELLGYFRSLNDNGRDNVLKTARMNTTMSVFKKPDEQ